MKKSRTFDEIFPLRDVAGPETPELARSSDETVAWWYRQCAGILRRYLAFKFGGYNAQDAQDIVQEAFLRFHEALLGGESIDNPPAWVWIVARRLMLDRIKRTGSEAAKRRALALRQFTPVETPEDVLREQRMLIAFERALQTLSETERRCVDLRANGMKLVDIGRIVGLDHRRVSKIIARLKRLVENARE